MKVLLSFLFFGALALQGAQTAGPLFNDVTARAGIDFKHCLGARKIGNIVEATGSGCAWIDFDRDGKLDLYLVNGRYLEGVSDPRSPFKGASPQSRLYRNNGDGSFTDVTAKSGAGNEDRYGMGVLAGDYDNDGFTDLYVTNYSGNVLYHNNGDGTFADVTAKAGVAVGRWSTGAAFLDYDKDGLADLFVGVYLEFDSSYRLYYEADVYPGPLAYPAQASVLYHNNGDGTFTDVTEKAGVGLKGRAMGVLTVDYDDDGWTDIFVANDNTPNFLFHNNANGTFKEVALASAVAFGQNGNAAASMGGDFGDFDRDGKLDLIVPAMGYNALYRNMGRGIFEDVAMSVGLAVISGQYWSWGGKFLDYDNDGYLDVMVVNGDGHRLSDTQEAILARNVPGAGGKRVYQDVAEQSGPFFHTKSVARGLALGDYDNDGDVDAFILNIDQASMLVQNDGGNSRNWLVLDLAGTRSNRDALGAKVEVKAGDLTQYDEKKSGTSYLSQCDPRMHFGLGNAAGVDEVRIKWPNGVSQVLKGVKPNQILKLTEPGN